MSRIPKIFVIFEKKVLKNLQGPEYRRTFAFAALEKKVVQLKKKSFFDRFT